MSHVKVAEGIYSVGVLNPSLRVFDIVMSTAYGTTYNSYLVQGSEKTAIIEASHIDYFEYYLENIKEVADIMDIDYVIMNHNEPDHSGSIGKLISLNPNIEVIATPAGAMYLKNILNHDSPKIRVVKEGDSIDLGGGKVLKFISAPFLHWPDTMFTWLEQDGVLFSCDFLGAHYCEPQMKDTLCDKIDKYEDAFLGYYNAIFGPFKPYVLDGLEKIKDLDIKYACTSHGPILSKGCKLEENIEKYKLWSTQTKNEKASIPIFYCSAYGNTEKLAKAIAEGIKKVLPSANIETFDIIENEMGLLGEKLNNSDAFLIGSPTLNKDAVPPVWQLLAHIDAINIHKKKAAIFGSCGWSGEAFKNLNGRLSNLKVDVFDAPFKITLVASEKDLVDAFEYGKSFGEYFLA